MNMIPLIFVILLVAGFVLIFMKPGRMLFDVVVFIVLLFLLLGQMGVLSG